MRLQPHPDACLTNGIRRYAFYSAITLSGCSLLACVSQSNGTDSTQAPTPVGVAEPTKNEKAAPQTEQEKNRQEIARLQAELQTVREEMKSLERNVELLMRGERSGIFSAEIPPGEPNADAKSAPKQPEQTKATPLPNGTVSTVTVEEAEPPKDETGNNPLKRIAETELKIRSGKYHEAIVILNEIQRTMPNLDDQGRSLLLLANCYNQTQRFDAALSILQTFYLRFPGSSDLPRAKLLEGQAQEGVGAKERALRVYRDIIATGPHSPQAETARSAMQRLRDEK